LIVTDKEGHHVTGLKQEDFRVFEDGVEQKISAFAAQSSGLPSAPSAASAPAEALAAATPATANLAPVRRTYLVVIDTLHTAFPNFVHLRDALQKLFREEQAGDSQYVVMAIARSLQLIQNTTRDPAVVLKAIESKEFQKIFQGSQKSSLQAELDRYRRELDETRAACDRLDPDCPARKMVLPPQANSIAELDRSLTTGFLRQFRFLIEQLAHTTGRKTIVLMSDGFSLTPGKAALEYLVTYFPESRSAALRSHERIQDEFEPVVRLAATNNIPIYTVDSRGLYTNEYFDASNRGGTPRMGPGVQRAMSDVALSEGDTLGEMAAATGGTVFHNSNDLLSGLRRAFADGREYYTLAYVSSNLNMDGKFRAIRIEVRDRKAVVKAKRGYWATGN
jgi:VWFA-related protein